MAYILKVRPDIVHFNVSFQSFGEKKIVNMSGLSLILLSRLLGFKVIASLHTIGETADLEQFDIKNNFINRVGILIATKIILSAQTVIVLVHSYVNLLTQRYHHPQVKYIPHGTTVDDPDPKKDKPMRTVLVFGHMGPHKGLPLMLKTLDRLRSQKVNVKLLIGGTDHPNYPNYLNQFKQARIPNVEFSGYVPEEKLEEYFKRAEVVVLPYHAAPGTSGVFHLACGFGRPIVASNLPEIRELVNDGAAAILVPTGNTEALKDAILKILSNEELAQQMSTKNLKFAEKNDWSVVAQAYEEAYQALIAA